MKRALIILALASLACMTPSHVTTDDTSVEIYQESERKLSYVAPPTPTPVPAYAGEKWRMP